MTCIPISFAFFLMLLVVSESAPPLRPNRSGKEQGSIENEGSFPEKDFGDPPLDPESPMINPNDKGFVAGFGKSDFPDVDDDEDDEITKHGGADDYRHEDDDEHKVPAQDEDFEDDESSGDAEDLGENPVYGGFMVDTPFFNFRQVAKYFQQLEKALAQMFRQTMDEATILNGTYANTTKEEVEIEGKKYIVQKSIIKGKDNNSSIYIEALSSAPKLNKTKTADESEL